MNLQELANIADETACKREKENKNKQKQRLLEYQDVAKQYILSVMKILDRELHIQAANGHRRGSFVHGLNADDAKNSAAMMYLIREIKDEAKCKYDGFGPEIHVNVQMRALDLRSYELQVDFRY